MINYLNIFSEPLFNIGFMASAVSCSSRRSLLVYFPKFWNPIKCHYNGKCTLSRTFPNFFGFWWTDGWRGGGGGEFLDRRIRIYRRNWVKTIFGCCGPHFCTKLVHNSRMVDHNRLHLYRVSRRILLKDAVSLPKYWYRGKSPKIAFNKTGCFFKEFIEIVQIGPNDG